MADKKRILILTSDTGGGHTSAARAIEAGLGLFVEKLPLLIHISKVIEESSFLARQSVTLYNFLLRYYQSYVKHYHWLINKVGPDKSFYRFSRKYLEQLLDRCCPNMIVSVHPMVQHSIVRILQELNLLDRVPLVTVVTDPCGNSWKGWASEHVSLYLVAHEQARQELISYGVNPEKIRICGMPIHPKFQQAMETVSPEEVRTELGLIPDKFTVFINAGWVGGGNIPKIFARLAASNVDAQGIFLAGRNKKLEEEANRIAAASRFPVKVIGYSEKMERLMRAADVMVSKLGGLTTFEALACRLPIVMDHITPPMPQEAGTGDLIENSNAGIRIYNIEDIVPIVRKLVEDQSHYLKMRAGTQLLAMPDATKKIVQELSCFFNPDVKTELVK